jgi:hypothetical protein
MLKKLILVNKILPPEYTRGQFLQNSDLSESYRIITVFANNFVNKPLSPIFSTPFTAFMFCLFGMLYNIWHPMWLIFLTVPIYYPIANAIDRYIASSLTK